MRENLYTLQIFINKYPNFHRHKVTGLMYWEIDESIRGDNNSKHFLRDNMESVSNKAFQNWNFLVLNMAADGKEVVEEF